MNENNIIREVLSTIQTNTKKPEKFLSVQNDVEIEIRNSLKKLYDFTKIEANNINNALPELIIENVDEEHIWQQLELQNESVIPDLITDISHIVAKNNLFTLPITQESENQFENNNNNNNNDDDDDDEQEEEEDEKVNDEMEYEHEINSDGEIDSKSKTKKMKSKKKKPSIVDDKFFKLNQLDEFLTKEDKKELQNKPDDSDDSSEESIDLFDNYLGNDENDDDDDDDNDNEDGRMLKYADFFDSPESADDDDDDDNDDNDDKNVNDDVENVAQDELEADHDSNDNNIKSNKIKRIKQTDDNNKRVKFNLLNNADSDFDSVDNDNKKSDVEEETIETKSSFESRKERVDKKIKELETAAISKKPWQLRGEVTATSRPPNSLLEEYLEFDVTSRPAPIMTETTNLKLEEIIKQRIKDKAWDDVQRKIKPIETPMEYKKKLVMDQEKSKKSLSQIYEDAYLKQKQTLDPDNQEREEEESKEFKEIRQGIQSLINKLDALSNYHCTPKPAQPDIKIISNLPAINMEEVAPVATADATLLAPEEVQIKKRGDLIGESERTDTDKNRQRRKKKKVQRLKQKAIENKEKNLIDNKKRGKIVKDVLIKKLTTDRNIKTVNSSNVKTAKSSTDFFARLQEKSSDKSINNKLDKKKSKNSSAIKYKL